MKIRLRVCQISTFLWIFSIPTSLAYHFNKSAGLVHGILVDYRIPTMSASFCLLILTVACCALQKHIPKKSAIFALIFTLVFQSVVAFYQFHTQHSLTGYIPLGEVSFRSPQIVMGTFLDGNIYKLPYGTTVHPNVLAGFFVLSFLLLAVQKILPLNRVSRMLIFLDVVCICGMTQSLTAAIALIFGLLFFYVKKFRILIVCVPLLSVLIFSIPSLAKNSNPSLFRRSDLQSIAFAMIRSHPGAGIGWNNFTLYQEDYGYVPSTVRFLQPVHNAFLLLATELGIIGWILCAALCMAVYKIRPAFLPLVAAVFFISSFDHYLLTLTTGRMILLLCTIVYVLELKTVPPPRIELGLRD